MVNVSRIPALQTALVSLLILVFAASEWGCVPAYVLESPQQLPRVALTFYPNALEAGNSQTVVAVLDVPPPTSTMPKISDIRVRGGLLEQDFTAGSCDEPERARVFAENADLSPGEVTLLCFGFDLAEDVPRGNMVFQVEFGFGPDELYLGTGTLGIRDGAPVEVAQ